jgi:uncharacterized membrane protein
MLFYIFSMGYFDGVQDLCSFFFSFLAMFVPIPLRTFDLTGTYGSCLACLLFGLKPSGLERLL